MKHVSHIWSLLFLLVICLAVGLRLPRLDVRPMHADEAVQATIFRELWLRGKYTYDPNEFHGPTLAYATLPSPLLSGATGWASTTEITYRIVPVLFGIGVVALLLMFVDSLGNTAVLAAALLTAVSPAMVFYSRYYIHETLLVFFSLAAIGCGWRYVATRKWSWCLLTGLCAGLMQATKETAVIAYLAVGMATLLTWLDARRYPHDAAASEARWWPQLLMGVSVAVVVAAAFLSSFCANPRGPIDGILTYFPWLGRAGGQSPHIYAWSFYWHRLVWWHENKGPLFSEAAILVLAVIGMVASFASKRGPAAGYRIDVRRWLAWYTIAVAAVYTLIQYKTPWCMLQFLIGMNLLGGIGVAALLRVARSAAVRAVLILLLTVAIGHLGWQAYQASYQYAADPQNPYVFAQTSADVVRLDKQLAGLERASKQDGDMPVKVIWGDPYYWPLPWYLRRFRHVQWWRTMPEDPVAPVIIATPKYDRELTVKLGDDFIMTGYYELRPGVLLQLWVRYDLWVAYLKSIGRID